MSLHDWRLQRITSANNNSYRFIAIDPGTDTLGIAFCEIDLLTNKFYIHDVTTLHASRMITEIPGYVDLHGEKHARLKMLEDALGVVFNYWRPDAIISEAPFMGRFAAAFGALVECMSAIRRAVFRYRRYMVLETVDPPSAKKSVGVKAKGGSKDDIKRAVIADSRITFDAECGKLGHTEHEYDAVAVGKWKYLKFIGEI